jgi:hypothetical protein
MPIQEPNSKKAQEGLPPAAGRKPRRLEQLEQHEPVDHSCAREARRQGSLFVGMRLRHIKSALPAVEEANSTDPTESTALSLVFGT